MKNINIIYKLLILSFFIHTSCAKKESENDSKVSISFKIQGISDYDNNSLEILASTNSTNQSEIIKPILTKKITHQNLDAEVELYESEDTLQIENKNANNKLKKLDKKKYASTTTLATDTKYRILVYDSNGTYIDAIDGSSGSTPSSLAVNYNQTYYWYAYSFNQTNPLPALSDTSNPTIEATQNLGLLYDSGTITPNQIGNNTIEVVFNRRLSWIKLIIDSRGTFAPLISSGLKITTNNLTSSTFNIKQNNYTNRTNVQGILEGSNDFTQLDPVTQDSILTANIYVADDGRNENFAIILNNILLKLDYLEPSNNIATRAFTNVNYNFDFKPEPGKKYIVRVRLIESGVNINGTTWARGNLYYTWGDNGFRFRHSNTFPYTSKYYPWPVKNDVNYILFQPGNYYSDHTNRSVEFWNFKTMVPYSGDQLYDEIKVNNSSYNDPNLYQPYVGKNYFYENITGKGPQYYASLPEGDPCSLVYPQDKWRLPTKNEAEDLLTQLNNNVNKTVILDNDNQHYTGNFPVSSVTNSPYGNALQFTFSGAFITAAGHFTGFGTGYPSDQLGWTADPRFGYEMTNSFYQYDSQYSDFEKSAYMMYWTSDIATSNSTNYKYGWAYSMKIKDDQFASLDNENKYDNTIGGYPNSMVGGTKAPQLREVYQGNGLNIRCVRK